MSHSQTNSSANKVVSLNSLGRDRSPGQRILAECRDQLVTHLCVWLRGVATPISEELFVLADSTRERLKQTRYLDLRADIEKDWSHLVDTFRRDLSAEAERCQHQESQKETHAAIPIELPDFEGLELLDDDELSEHIVIREFSAQLAETCDAELYTLNRRVAALLGHDELLDSVNPLAPAIICQALSDSCATIGADAEGRLLLLRRLERQLHASLPGIYQQINAFLIERGILPDLKRTFRRSPVSGTGASTASPQTGQTGTGGGAETGAGSGMGSSGEGILEALQRLAQARAGNMPAMLAGGNSSGSGGAYPASFPTAPGGFASGGQGMALDPDAINHLLLSSLNEMQRAPAGESTGVIVNQVRLVRESEHAQKVGGLEAVTIDIVAMLFDFIFDDAHIPVAIKALLSRLQIPVLKVAMLNPGFFADRQHPTRRFLGSVSGVSIRWGGAVDETDPFYCKLAELVEKIQSEFENDVEVFGTALTELEAFVDEREGEEDSTALTAANIVMLREQETIAWERAQRAVHTFSTSASLPPLVDAFLREHWVGVLQAIAITNDEQSADWQAANETMSDLAWSIKAKKSSDERLKLISMLPRLLGQINKGLDSVKADPAQRSVFFDSLVKCHSAALKGETPVPKSPEPEWDDKALDGALDISGISVSETDGELQITHSVDNGVEVEEITLVGGSPVWRADDREIYRQVSELKRGDWVEFRETRDGEEMANRERLNWISPQRGILLFSNHRSAKAISIAPDALARQIRDGQASILHEIEIFESALNGALESLNAGE